MPIRLLSHETSNSIRSLSRRRYQSITKGVSNIFAKPNFKRRKPKRGQRGVITQKQYALAIENFGNLCSICGSAPIEMHHCVFRSQGGRGGYRNLIPLCKKHHDEAHKNSGFALQLKTEREERYGKYFSCDRFDLSEHGHIEDSSEEAFEKFMREEENK